MSTSQNRINPTIITGDSSKNKISKSTAVMNCLTLALLSHF